MRCGHRHILTGERPRGTGTRRADRFRGRRRGPRAGSVGLLAGGLQQLRPQAATSAGPGPADGSTITAVRLSFTSELRHSCPSCAPRAGAGT